MRAADPLLTVLLDIATPSTPTCIVSWTQVRAVDAHRGEVRVFLFEASTPVNVAVSAVPDVFVVLALAEALRIDAQRA